MSLELILLRVTLYQFSWDATMPVGSSVDALWVFCWTIYGCLLLMRVSSHFLVVYLVISGPILLIDDIFILYIISEDSEREMSTLAEEQWYLVHTCLVWWCTLCVCDIFYMFWPSGLYFVVIAHNLDMFELLWDVFISYVGCDERMGRDPVNDLCWAVYHYLCCYILLFTCYIIFLYINWPFIAFIHVRFYLFCSKICWI